VYGCPVTKSSRRWCASHGHIFGDARVCTYSSDPTSKIPNMACVGLVMLVIADAGISKRYRQRWTLRYLKSTKEVDQLRSLLAHYCDLASAMRWEQQLSEGECCRHGPDVT
jgi:hypothetical protein